MSHNTTDLLEQSAPAQIQLLARLFLENEATHNLLLAQFATQKETLLKLVSQLAGLSETDLHSQILQLQLDKAAMVQERDELKDKVMHELYTQKLEKDVLLAERDRFIKEIDALKLKGRRMAAINQQLRTDTLVLLQRTQPSDPPKK